MRLRLLTSVIVLSVSTGAFGQDPVGQRALVIEADFIIDGRGSPARVDSRVIVRAERIECVGDSRDCPTPEGAQLVALEPGSWVLPGLVDAHVHFGQTAWFDGRPSSVDLRGEYPYEAVMARQKTDPKRYFRSYLCSGVTAVFDTGGYPWSLDLKLTAEHDPFAPHVAAAGPRITHAPPEAMNLPAEQQYLFLADEPSGRAMVRANAAFGADAIKIWFLRVPEGEEPEIDARVMAVGDEARAAGLPLIVHATTLREAKVALRAGAHLLVHGVDDQPVDDELIELAKERGAIYTPTLLVSEGYLRMFQALTGAATAELVDPNGCVDAETRRRITESARFRAHPSVRALELDLAAYRAQLDAAYERKVENLRRVHAAGVPIALGTDAGNPGTLHGPGIYPELEAMQAAGIDPAALIVMATRNGARAMGRDDIGALTAGKIADLIVVSESPVDDIRNLRSITHVMRAGRLHRVSDLASTREQ